ncbi:MAG: CBS and ACT domain-containing protein [Thermodesulfobacteriota bacterium]
MLIKEWMAKDVLSVDENTSVMRATRMMKENRIRRLPVVSHGRLIGVVTDRDLKDASPSKTTSLDIHELYYLLSEMKVKDVMTPSPITVSGDDTVEKAAVILLENRISGLMVVDELGHLIGILSETDILRSFIHSTGIKDGAIQYVFELADAPGAVGAVIDAVRAKGARMVSILTSYEDVPEGRKQVAVRVTVDDEAILPDLSTTLAAEFKLLYQVRDELKDLPRKNDRA